MRMIILGLTGIELTIEIIGKRQTEDAARAETCSTTLCSSASSTLKIYFQNLPIAEIRLESFFLSHHALLVFSCFLQQSQVKI
jgi:hypothetical protein